MINLQVNIKYCNETTKKIKNIRTLQSVYQRGRLVNMIQGLIFDSVKNIYLDSDCLQVSNDNRYFDIFSIVNTFNGERLNDEFNKLLIKPERFKLFMCLDIYLATENESYIKIEKINYLIKSLDECGFTAGDFLS